MGAKMGTVQQCSFAGLIFEATANIFSRSTANHFRTQCHRFVCSREAGGSKKADGEEKAKKNVIVARGSEPPGVQAWMRRQKTC